MKRFTQYVSYAALLCLLLVPALTLSAQRNRAEQGERERASPEMMSFLGNPAEHMQSIHRILRETGEKIMEQRRALDNVVARVVANERRLNASNVSAADRERIRQENIASFREIETIRERIANIRHESAQQIFRIEQANYQAMIAGIARSRARITQNPAEYWLGTQKLLLSPSEQSVLLPEAEARAFYR
jgi:hypothetical protein